MNINIHPSWKDILTPSLNAPYFKALEAFVDNAYQTKECYPSKDQIFNALNACSFEDVKVVIIGQDPYHGPHQANGLCFSVNPGIKQPPSLVNIFKEIEQDLGIPCPKSGNLSRWAKQGVLLLNATLSVQVHKAGSHQKQGWETFTDHVIAAISEKKQDVVFLLWGAFAAKKGSKIDTQKHYVLTSGHPSPLSANRGYWFGNKHFSKCNAYLEEKGKTPIQW